MTQDPVDIAMAPAWNSGKSYTDLLASTLERHGARVRAWRYEARPERADVFHAHWPGDVVSAPEFGKAVSGAVSRLLRIKAARRTQGAFVWTVHNLTNHEIPHQRLHSHYWDLLVRQVDGWISPSAAAVSDILERWPALESRPHAVIPLGHYRSIFVPLKQPREEVNVRTALFFGKIRAYKGVVELVNAFHRVPDHNYRLVIAGRPRRNLDEALRPLQGDTRVTMDLRLISDTEIPALFAQADVCVLPFRHITNSSSALLSLSLEVPVLASDLPAMRELQDQVGEDWVRLWDPSEPLEYALDRELSKGRPRGAPNLDNYDWTAIGDSTVRFYEQVLQLSSKTGQVKRQSAAEDPHAARSTGHHDLGGATQ